MANVYMGKDVEDFIFNEGTEYENVNEHEEITDDELNAFGVIECVDDPEVACYRIALENEENYNRIMNACIVKEFSILESTGEEMVYEAGQIKKFFGWIKQQVQKFWSKVMGVFKRIQDFLTNLVQSNKAFCKKWKGIVISKPSESKTFKGFKVDRGVFNNDIYGKVVEYVDATVDTSKIVKMSKEDADKFAEDFKKSMDGHKEEMRLRACGKRCKDNEFNKALKLAFLNSEEKVELPLRPFTELISELEKADSARKAAKVAFNNAKGAVKRMLSMVNSAEKNMITMEGRKDNYGMKVAKCFTDLLNSSISIMSKTLSAQSNAISTMARQDRAMAAFYVAHYTPTEAEKKIKNESVIFDEEFVF